MRRRNKIDTVQPVLVARLRVLGADWLPWPGGPVDGFVWRRALFMVDFKTGTEPLTPRQEDLLARGWPLQILRTESDVDRLLGVEVQ